MSQYQYYMDLLPNCNVHVCILNVVLKCVCVRSLVFVGAWMYEPDDTEVMSNRVVTSVVEYEQLICILN